MMNILFHSVARAGGIELPAELQIVPRPGPAISRRLLTWFSDALASRKTRQILNSLDDRALADVGLRRDALRDTAFDMLRLQIAANDPRPTPTAANDSFVVIGKAEVG